VAAYLRHLGWVQLNGPVLHLTLLGHKEIARLTWPRIYPWTRTHMAAVAIVGGIST
jgi:hypothetical protein